jgi:flagellar basal-body rod protein FlgB
MDALDRFFGVHGAALALRSKRLDMLASNIANAATPHYKARDIDFAAELKAAEAGSAPATAVSPRALYRQPTQLSLDGNSVELATEQTAFAENAVQYQTTLAFLNGRIGTLMKALKGE